MVEVFKTNVQTVDESKLVLGILTVNFPELIINFDLDDCDKILRVQGKNIWIEKVIELVNSNGFYCEVLV